MTDSSLWTSESVASPACADSASVASLPGSPHSQPSTEEPCHRRFSVILCLWNGMGAKEGKSGKGKAGSTSSTYKQRQKMWRQVTARQFRCNGKMNPDFTSWLADLCPDGLILLPCSSLLWFSRNRAQERIGRWEQKKLRMWRRGTQMQNWCEDEDRAGQFMY